MGFVTPALLGGALLVSLPIVLHLIMRREATHLLFPALRFVQRRQTMNQHRLRLRHWLLLALRCTIIALLAFALARPVLRGSAMAGKENRPIATALVFDNSLRMEYRHENRSRLERAKELAGWLLGQLPPDSPVTVVDRAGQHRGSDTDRDAAELRVERLAISAAVRPLAEALRDAADWLAERDDYRGEIYVFTDLAAEAWPEDALAGFKARLDELAGTNVYLVDVAAREPRNLALGPLRLSNQQLAPGGLLEIATEVVATGARGAADVESTSSVGDTSEADPESASETPPAVTPPTENAASQPDTRDVVVELYLSDGVSQTEKRGQELVSLSGTRPAAIDFSLTNLPLGTHQGHLRIIASDPLPFDNVRYFTVEVRPPSNVLLLGANAGDTLFLSEALAPTSAAGLLQSKFSCRSATFSAWETIQLAEYDAICLVDPPPLAAVIWEELADFVQAGGGVGVFLGRNARRNEFNLPAAQSLLPATLRRVSGADTYLRPLAVEHPALAELRDFADAAPWSQFPVFKYWELEAGADVEAAHVVATFANGQPALVERVVGAGRVLMMTTSASDPAYNEPWNLLPTAPDPWPFLVLANGIAGYLTGASDVQLNFLAGQSVLLQLAPEERTTSYVLSMPGTSAVRQSLTPGQQDLSLPETNALGNYRVRAGGEQGRLDRGFSVNAAAELSRLERIAAEKIAAALGEDRVRVARTQEEIEVRVGLGRVGRELFPTLIVVLALVLGAEQLLANRFYRTAK